MGSLTHERYARHYEATLWREAETTLSELEVDLAGKHVYDVGCGNGWFLRGALAAGAASAEGHEFPGQKIERADVITLWDVLEHAIDPKLLIAQCKDALRLGGELVIQTPIVSEYTKALGSTWRFLSAPHHVHLFSKKSLLVLLGSRWNRSTSFGSGFAVGIVPSDARRFLSGVLKKNNSGDEIALVWRKHG